MPASGVDVVGAPEVGDIRRTAQFPWDAGSLPFGKGKPATGIGRPGYAAAKKSRTPDEAWVLVSHLTNKEVQVRLSAEMAPFWRAEKTARDAAGAVKQQVGPLLQEAKRLEDAAK